MRAIAAGLISLGLALTGSGAANAIQVERQLVVDGTVDAIWQKVGEACSLKVWASSVTDCTEKKRHGNIVRTVTAKNGGKFVEEIVASGHGFYAYHVLQSTLPVSNYIAIVSMTPDANDASRTLITWRGNFDAKDVDKVTAANIVGAIYEGGLASIAAYTKKSP